MNALAMTDVTYDGKALALIRRTVAADANDDEFEMFIAMARGLRLNPLRRQLYCFVFNKNNAERRKMSIVVAIDGFRTVAARTKDYRPDSQEPQYEYDATLKGPTNPLGLVKCSVTVYRYSHGAWFPIVGTAYWDEFAPLKDEWAESDSGKRKPTGKKTLEGKWPTMGRHMLAKCAEALALRKGWPDEFSNVYSEEEVDRERTLDLTATEIIDEAAKAEREKRIGGPSIFVDWCDGQPLDSVPVGQFADRVLGFISELKDEPGGVAAWADRNRLGLREFWKHHPGDALEIKTRIEAVAAAPVADD